MTKASQANSPVVQAPTQARASAQSGAIQPGDLLSSCPRAGTAAGVREISVDGVRVAAPGTVFGKALEALDAPEGPIYVFVTLQ